MSDETTTTLTDDIRAKRVAVAKDVKERIALGRLTVDTGVYLEFNEPNKDDDRLLESDCDLQVYVDQVESKCTVCALGAVLLSKARLYDAVPMKTIAGAGCAPRFRQALSDIFDDETLKRIESAFEQSCFGDTDYCNGAAIFGYEFHDQVARCLAVMDRIIEGNGEFLVDPVTYGEYQDFREAFYD